MNPIFSHTIERWYEQNKRELPWRDTRDPYRIWISEIILQQTRVAQGFDYFVRFLRRFPDVESLATATEDDVLIMWQGLGYYSRARNLHKAAKQVVAMGGFPTDYAVIRSLPGIGDYTAAAIASFAFDSPHAVLDGNVYRVLSRYFNSATPIDSTQGKHEFTALAHEMLDPHHSALYNQAIMEFGAIMCKPNLPACSECPLCDTCSALQCGTVAELPVKSKKLAVRTRHLIYIYMRIDGNIVLHRRVQGDIWTGLYEPLLVESSLHSISVTDKATEPNGLQQHVFSNVSDKRAEEPILNHPVVHMAMEHGATLTLLHRGMKHQLSHQLLVSDFYVLQCPSGFIIPSKILKDQSLIIVPECERENYATPRLLLEFYKKLTLSS